MEYSVLLAEDDEQVRSSLKRLLSNFFSKVYCTSNGKEALEIFDSQPIDAIVTDLDMPYINGFELIEAIQKKSTLIPTIVISGTQDYTSLARAIELDVKGYLLKPIESQKFKLYINRVLDRLHFLHKTRRQEKLLCEYKEAIDRSAIVSKTDKKGIITYVNDSFCNISGYKREELLQKPHNIIRHPDMPSSAFASLWQTIKDGNAWQGTIKNRKKDGSSYYVQSLVNPILNEKGEIEEYIAIRTDVTELEMYKQDLKARLDESVHEIVETQKEIVYTLGTIGEKRSLETGVHVRRVANYSYMLAKLFGLKEEEALLLKHASPMHDIGKIGIPDAILNKPGPLNDEEWVIIKSHSQIGYDMLKHSQRDILKAAAIIAHQHHERWDGKGYPQGLKGEEIHIFGRITAIVDVYDALGHDRVYKKAWKNEDIIHLMKEESGFQFDPNLCKIFLKHFHAFEEAKKNLS